MRINFNVQSLARYSLSIDGFFLSFVRLIALTFLLISQLFFL